MLFDFTMFPNFSFLMPFIVSLDGCDQVSTALCKHKIIYELVVSAHSSGVPMHVRRFYLGFYSCC